MPLAKHWNFNKDEDLVLSNLKGFVHSNPEVKLIPSEKVIFNPNSDTSKKVCLISGGGAGHEPLHGGFVGDGLLDAAVSGTIFASPSTKQIMAAIKTKSNKDKGTLVITKNYTGDVLHFGLVVERAKSEGYNVDMIPVADDVAVGREQNKMVGRRGLAGTAIVHKVLGAASQITGGDLKSIVGLGHAINNNMVTIGASLDRTSVPGKNGDEIEFTGSNEAELGLGIHNEPGQKLSPIPNIDDLIDDMYHKLLSPEDKDRHYVEFDLKNDDYALLINNIGGTSSLELYAIAEHVVNKLPLSKKPSRVLISDFVTSLNSPGFSITLLNLSNISKSNDTSFDSKDILSFLDAPTNAPGWKPKHFKPESWDKSEHTQYVETPMKHENQVTSTLKIDGSFFASSLKNSLEKLLKEEPKITHYDTVVGDGDCGETLAAGANAILDALKSDSSFKSNLSDPVATLSKITEIVEDNMGGTSGGIYSIYLTALVKNLQKADQVDTKSVAQALYDALYDGLFKYTKARVGGRTLVDTLQPFVDTLHKSGNLKDSVSQAKKSCDETRNLQAKFGRASYVNDDEFKSEEGGIPDPGAVGLLAIIEGFVESV